MKRKHILIISQYFFPEPFRINDIASEWVKRGHNVTVLTGIPNYPMGKFYTGYGLRQKRNEKWNGVNIIRIPLIPRGNSQNRLLNSLGMVANYFSFVLSGRLWISRCKVKADLVFTYEVSPMTQALIGCWYGIKHQSKVFLYVQDLWPENVETITGIHSALILYPIDKMVRWIYQHSDAIFTTSPSFVKAISNRGIDNAKIFYWPQYAEDCYKPRQMLDVKNDYGENRDSVKHRIPSDGFNIAFTGNIGTAQGLSVLPRAAEIIKHVKGRNDSSHIKEMDIHFIIIGDGRYQNEFEGEITKRKVEDMFVMIPRQKPENIAPLLACCDMAFVSFSETQVWEMTIPAKLQSYMACGMPILAAAGGETKRIINEANCGVCVRNGDAKSLAESIMMLTMRTTELCRMGDNSLRYYKEHFEKEKLMDEMESYINHIC